MINLEHINKSYFAGDLETKVLEDINLKVNTGEFVAIMGPSGSGKSTMMHILGLLDLPTSGSYKLDGGEVGKFDEDELADIRNKKIGFVFQSFNLLPRTSALKNVMLPMQYAGILKTEREGMARKLLDTVELTDRVEHTPSQLSGGQQQRVAVARALAIDPAIILADEPTGNLASKQGEEIMELFTRLNKQGKTIVMITHEPSIAKFAKRVITLKDGRIVDDKLNRSSNV